MNKASALIIGVLLGVALVVAAWVIAGGFGQIAKPDHTVTVRGLAETEVDADLAVWTLTYEFGNNDLAELQKEIVQKNNDVVAYLTKYGLTADDYTIQSPNIDDRMLMLGFDEIKQSVRFLAKSSILIRSKNVKSVKDAHDHTLELVEKNVVINQDGFYDVIYEYTALNDIKPKMIGDATKNARDAANQFASDSGSSVGKIKNAMQGYFSIEEAAPGLAEKKKIRVVTTIEFVLDN